MRLGPMAVGQVAGLRDMGVARGVAEEVVGLREISSEWRSSSTTPFPLWNQENCVWGVCL